MPLFGIPLSLDGLCCALFLPHPLLGSFRKLSCPCSRLPGARMLLRCSYNILHHGGRVWGWRKPVSSFLKSLTVLQNPWYIALRRYSASRNFSRDISEITRISFHPECISFSSVSLGSYISYFSLCSGKKHCKGGRGVLAHSLRGRSPSFWGRHG